MATLVPLRKRDRVEGALVEDEVPHRHRTVGNHTLQRRDIFCKEIAHCECDPIRALQCRCRLFIIVLCVAVADTE